ncbi:hypothetical protein IFM46972_02129 [Aspergillus udagawae]|uniref:Uncharacterized protein n=1 Tax=Aspergillus udagawae TaxID=91492 RepID=A0A8H3RJW2_9EURO|nr:hypothetical protein IFM46972_02129 [Aspergillus udagawae]
MYSRGFGPQSDFWTSSTQGHAQAEQQPRTQHVSPFSKALVTLYELFGRHGTSSFAATVGTKQGTREERVGEWVV